MREVDFFSFHLEISFRQLLVCYFVASFLTKGRVCNLLYNCFWALIEQSLLCRSPAELTAIFYSLISDSSNLKVQVPVCISHRNRVTQLYPRLLRLAGLRWRYCNPLPHGSRITSTSKSKSHYDLQSVGQLVLVSCPSWSR
jgi:hypothetical protein